MKKKPTANVSSGFGAFLINFRADEKALLKGASGRGGISMSEYIRQKLFIRTPKSLSLR